jgi:hypothetical protein
MKLLVFLLAARGTTAYSLPGVSHCRGAAHALSRASSPSMKEVVGNYGFASDDEFRHGNGERRRPSQFGLAPGSPKSMDPAEDFRQGTGRSRYPVPSGGTGRPKRSKYPRSNAYANPADEFREGTGRTVQVPLGGQVPVGGTGRPKRSKRARDDEQKLLGDPPEMTEPAPAMEPAPTTEPAPMTEPALPEEDSAGLVTRGGTTVERQKSWADPSEDFRHGTGSTDVVPFGGTGRPVRRKAAERARRWAESTDDFRHGNGERAPRPMGGPDPF